MKSAIHRVHENVAWSLSALRPDSRGRVSSAAEIPGCWCASEGKLAPWQASRERDLGDPRTTTDS